MDIKEAIRIFEDNAELELFKHEWDKVEEALKEILTKVEKEKSDAWNEGYECARDEYSENGL